MSLSLNEQETVKYLGYYVQYVYKFICWYTNVLKAYLKIGAHVSMSWTSAFYIKDYALFGKVIFYANIFLH